MRMFSVFINFFLQKTVLATVPFRFSLDRCTAGSLLSRTNSQFSSFKGKCVLREVKQKNQTKCSQIFLTLSVVKPFTSLKIIQTLSGGRNEILKRLKHLFPPKDHFFYEIKPCLLLKCNRVEVDLTISAYVMANEYT